MEGLGYSKAVKAWPSEVSIQKQLKLKGLNASLAAEFVDLVPLVFHQCCFCNSAGLSVGSDAKDS